MTWFPKNPRRVPWRTKGPVVGKSKLGDEWNPVLGTNQNRYPTNGNPGSYERKTKVFGTKSGDPLFLIPGLWNKISSSNLQLLQSSTLLIFNSSNHPIFLSSNPPVIQSSYLLGILRRAGMGSPFQRPFHSSVEGKPNELRERNLRLSDPPSSNPPSGSSPCPPSRSSPLLSVQRGGPRLHLPLGGSFKRRGRPPRASL